MIKPVKQNSVKKILNHIFNKDEKYIWIKGECTLCHHSMRVLMRVEDSVVADNFCSEECEKDYHKNSILIRRNKKIEKILLKIHEETQ